VKEHDASSDPQMFTMTGEELFEFLVRGTIENTVKDLPPAEAERLSKKLWDAWLRRREQ
jgi:hypothetical protein